MTSGKGRSPLVRSIVVMGVAGSGKTAVARALAERLNYEFIDADWFHSPENRAKMSSGQPLNDDDRYPWLRAVGQQIKSETMKQRGTVTACSALKRAYRDTLRFYVPDAFFVLLDGSPDVIRARIEARPREIIGVSLLSSQFAILEPLQDDERGVRVDIERSPDEIVNEVAAVATP
jgi:carbohydrate kinase (thermoresistant glucokinase family)